MGRKKVMTASNASAYVLLAVGAVVLINLIGTRVFGRLDLTESHVYTLAPGSKAIVANLPRHIADRECQTIAQKTGWAASYFAVEQVTNSRGPGNLVMIELESEHLTEVFTGFGQRGVRAEQVALDALQSARQYLAAHVPVGHYLADQLMLPLGIGAYQGSGGGTFRTMPLSGHATTHLESLRQFMDLSIAVEQSGRTDCTVRLA
jgi:RNA 3'-terminal phosphate cyclase (ATP)